MPDANDDNTTSGTTADADFVRRMAEVARQLEWIRDDRALLARIPEELRTRLLRAAGEVARPDPAARSALKKARRRAELEERRAADAESLARTKNRRLRIELVYPTPEHERLELSDTAGAAAQSRLREARNCYVCKAEFRELHHHYDQLCSSCAEFNWTKRWQTADLRGRVALLTGARVKIGYQAGIKLLRAGCRLIALTRFPRDAAARYAREKDFAEWSDRLEVYGIDLRHTPSVEALATHVAANYERLDFLLNNACQTVRRPPGYYAHLMAAETRDWSDVAREQRLLLERFEALRHDAQALREREAAAQRALAERRDAALPGIALSAALSQLAMIDGDLERGSHLFPAGELDQDAQQIDLRTKNSWRLALAEVPTIELLEVHLVNAVAPFVLNARLKPLMLRVPSRDKHIVNVSAMEGQFYRSFKTDKHPHTNMAKASLNMMTRTSAADYVRDGIHMNSVDTGWITDEDPVDLQAQKVEEHDFHPPLDIVDAAARICDPIFHGLNSGEHAWGQFFKDYRPTRW
jgi:NAD(P)-dependent dehydrogenase (short-subunit alcohol dehydrogenase family)